MNDLPGPVPATDSAPPAPVTRLLVANRGEIARRILSTCRTLGIATVAVYADTPEEAAAAHVAEADTAVRLPVPAGRGPVAAYLDPDALVAAARTAGADAVHPGYGFLSESPALARAVTAAGLTWVGPAADAIERMGAKTRAKDVAREAGVPVAAALDPEDVRPEHLPVLVKAVSGGGGRGMRVVRDLADLPAEAAAARAEAASAFGDPAVFCEPYVERGRHVEVQVLADTHGTVWALGERDCSVQRRHQKVIEETPAPGLPDTLRTRLHEAARRLARAIGYTGAGTAEFLVPVGEGADPLGEPVFLEMNTRLQVEHPVTECVTGLDLVEWQIRIAEGEPLPPGGPPAPRGHAVEARLYAEDPLDDWRPRTGTLHTFEVPAATVRRAPLTVPGVRLDSGVEPGDTVGTDFDPLLAKVVAFGHDRRDAVRRLVGALADARVHGVGTNRDLLVRALRHPAFADAHTAPARLHIGHLTGDRLTALAQPLADPATRGLAALAATLAEAEATRTGATVPAGVPAGWRNLPSQPHTRRYTVTGTGDGRVPGGTDGSGAPGGNGGTDSEVTRVTSGPVTTASYRSVRGAYVPDPPGVRVLAAATDHVVLEADGLRHTFTVHRAGGEVFVDSPLGSVALTPVDPLPAPEPAVAPGALPAPMPGTVTAVDVSVGEKVREGQTLLRLEAMKMEHRVTAPAAGAVRDLPVAPGQRVPAGALLAVLDHDVLDHEGPNP
ncbi:ATP-binding protein [Nocardiopsis aegyptia]|uniref:Propionyl-CoA carboxylase alpha chain n=1 Tax=Nocardiopsis aegyptia TaxID=220378 RepID=A0A7Z0ERU9_9ACTN|nr:biotin carboxylase N-terminal domain-containing protein [Nocardiopsis aegyptia]NYJ37130.1 propionyl-CoA carboxylase alpha chain [Nocardiopsis aegyptia]